MRLVAGSSQEFDVEWRFCHPTALPLDRPTVFDSMVWDWEHRSHSGVFAEELGEQIEGTCPQKWYRRGARGRPKGPPGTGEPHGLREWWVRGVPSASLFRGPTPTLICDTPLWMGRGLLLADDHCRPSFGPTDFFAGARLSWGGSGNFVFALPGAGNLTGNGTIQWGGNGVFEPSGFVGAGGLTLGGTGNFSREDVLVGTGGLRLDGAGNFGAPPLVGSAGLRLDGAGEFTLPPLAGNAGLLLGGTGNFLFGPSFAGNAGLLLGGTGPFGNVGLVGAGSLALDGAGNFGLVGLTGQGNVALSGEAAFGAPELVGAAGVQWGGDGDFEFSLS